MLAAVAPRRGPSARLEAMQPGLLKRERGGQGWLRPHNVVDTRQLARYWWERLSSLSPLLSIMTL